MSKIKLNINGMEVKGFSGQTVLDIARENNVEIPTLCYDDRVEIYGGCGLCVVEIEGMPKLARACATMASDKMVVKTHTNRTIQARKVALELLLSDHLGDCRGPCMLACPGHTDCQGYVGLIANGDYKEAVKTIKDKLPLPASIGRVCPHPCETACRRELVEEPIAIAQLKYFAADSDLNSDNPYTPELKPQNGKKVGIVGGGPGGLSAAYFLVQEGYEVTVYDSMEKMGGMLRYGIPQYRLPKSIVDKEAEIIESMGVKFINNVKIGIDISLEKLRKENDAVLIAVGAWSSTKLGCKGEDAEGVIGGIDFLREYTINGELQVGDRVVVVGGGNTAMDACRTAVRLGAKEVYNIYRRTKEEMPAEAIEIIEGEEEGVIFKSLVNPIEIISEGGRVKKIVLQKMALGEPDASGRRSPVAIEGETETMEVDTVISAIGQILDPIGLDGITLTKRGTVASDEGTFLTNLEGVFSVGDCINKGAGIAIAAIGDAKRAAEVIHTYLQGEIKPYKEPFYSKRTDLTRESFADREKIARAKMPHLKPNDRKNSFQEVNLGWDAETAKKEANRCLVCGCLDIHECKLVKIANDYDVSQEVYIGEVHDRNCETDHPFIMRNPDKCILCGLCVRTCEEVMGISAIGLVDRGFDTIVKPALDQNLEETGCIACGQCVSVCPVGALMERPYMEKAVPIPVDVKPSVCNSCSVGCSTKVNTRGQNIVRIEANPESIVDGGLLCSKGRWANATEKLGEKITVPMMKKNGKFVEISYEDAYYQIARKLKSFEMLQGSDSIRISVSDRYTNEEAFMANYIATKLLKIPYAVSYNMVESGMAKVLGVDASTNTFEELDSTDAILVIGSDLIKDYGVVGLKVRKAVQKGTKLAVINKGKTLLNEWADISVNSKNSLDILLQIQKAIIELGAKVEVPEVLSKSLENTKVSKEAMEIAKLYAGAKKAMIIFDQYTLSVDAGIAVANIAVLAGHIGKPRAGIIQLKVNSNTQGLCDMGISDGCKHKLSDGSVKALVSFGEDLSHIDLSGVEFLVVQDAYMTKTAKKADIILPAAGLAQSTGTYTSSERRIQEVSSSVEGAIVENWKVMVDIANAMGAKLEVTAVEDIKDMVSKNVPTYSEYNLGASFQPTKGNRVLCGEGNFDLQVVENGEMFIKHKNTNAQRNLFEKFLADNNM
ncbi:MAG: molybdopterin-dependent oxidoreductase [Filifactoraceae bacterium]